MDLLVKNEERWMDLHSPEEIIAGLNHKSVFVEIQTGGFDLGSVLGCASVGIKLPCLSSNEVVCAVKIRAAICTLCCLQLPHLYIYF